MIRLTYRQREANKKLRHQIIDEIMEIQDTESLDLIYAISKGQLRKELSDHILDLQDAVSMLDMDMVNKLYHLFSKDKENYMVKDQMLELCGETIRYYKERGGEEDWDECTS